MSTFSADFEKLLRSKRTNTLGALADEFAEKSFAVLLLLFLAVTALPIPTGGITHVLEVIAALVAAEMVAGRTTVWLPKKFADRPLPKGLQSVALPKFIAIIRWFERFSKPRFRLVHTNQLYIRILGLMCLIFIVFAFFAPPFTGLDTLPALGVVTIALAIILEDPLLSLLGLIFGGVGVVLVLFLGRLALHLL